MDTINAILEDLLYTFFIIEYLRSCTKISRLNLSPAIIFFFLFLRSPSINQWPIARVRYNTRRATFVTATYEPRNGQKNPVREASSSVLTRANEWSLSQCERKKKSPREKKIATFFSLAGPNRARLRHAAVACQTVDEIVSPLISSEGILVLERLSSLLSSLFPSSATRGRRDPLFSLGHREKL